MMPIYNLFCSKKQASKRARNTKTKQAARS